MGKIPLVSTLLENISNSLPIREPSIQSKQLDNTTSKPHYLILLIIPLGPLFYRLILISIYGGML